MNTKKIVLFAGAAIVVAGGLVLAIRMNNSTSTRDGQGAIGARIPLAPVIQSTSQPNAQPEELTPFTHVTSIPATVDPSTIRFEKLKMVELASKTQTVSGAQNCKDRQFRDPDGANCESVKVVARVKALEASYSFIGPELSTGEATPGRATFSVYFRPEELPVDGSVEKLKREQAGALFQVSTSHPMVQQKVVDKQNSHFCEGSYVDGNWKQADPKCQDQVQYITQTGPSANWTVEVNVRHPATMVSH
jgi:hypothetical protein